MGYGPPMSPRWRNAALIMGAIGFMVPLARGISANAVIGGAINGLAWIAIIGVVWLVVEAIRRITRRA